jgi:hypothetical protein
MPLYPFEQGAEAKGMYHTVNGQAGIPGLSNIETCTLSHYVIRNLESISHLSFYL